MDYPTNLKFVSAGIAKAFLLINLTIFLLSEDFNLPSRKQYL